MSNDSEYAFPHSAEDESRRLELFGQRLDPLTKRRIEHLGSVTAPDASKSAEAEDRSPGGSARSSGPPER